MQDVVDRLLSVKNPAITAHVRPDGDAIGSAMALKHILAARGVTATVLDFGPFAKRYRPLIEDEVTVPVSETSPDAYDALFVMDSGTLKRVPEGLTDWVGRVPIVNIDHHQTNEQFGTANLVDVTSSSTGELLAVVAQEAGLEITQEAAAALWVAIVTDTGRFSYANTTPRTLRVAADLIACDIPTVELNHGLFEVHTMRELELEARAINNLTRHCDDRLAVLALSRDDFSACDAGPIDAEDTVDLARDLEGVEVALFLYELPDQSQTKISIRSAPPFDAAELCRELGGGGHQRAAGCEIEGPLTDVRPKVTELIAKRWFS